MSKTDQDRNPVIRPWLRRHARRIMAGTALTVVAGDAGFISYGHIESLSLRLGQPVMDARLMPFGVDGLILAGSVVLLDSDASTEATRGGWIAVGAGVSASVFANVESGIGHGWLAAGWAGVPAIAFALATTVLKLWVAHGGKPKQPAVPEAQERPEIAATPVAVEPAALPAVEADPLPGPSAATLAVTEPTPAPVMTAPRPLPAPEPVKAPAPTAAPVAPKPAPVKAPVVQQKQQQSDDGQPRTCCAAHRAQDAKDKLDREQAPAVWSEHQAAHGREIGAGVLEKIFGMGTRPARLLRDELKSGRPGPAPAQDYPGNPGSTEPGLSGAGAVATPGGPGSPNPAQGEPPPAQYPGSADPAHPGSTPARTRPGSPEPEPATPAHGHPGSPVLAVSRPGSALAEPGLEDGEPDPALMAGSGAAK